MKKVSNFVQAHSRREQDIRYAPILQENFRVTPSYIKRLGLYGELKAHHGCVNCLEWGQDGSVLASGSDDTHVVIHDPFKKKVLCDIPTGHTGNIFSVKFLPNTENRTLVSGAADNTIRIHDLVSKDLMGVCTCHENRVKRCATDALCPSMFWSAGEDGLIIQHDLRSPHVCSENQKEKNVLIDLKKYIGNKAEAKCLAVNPVRTEHIAVGANDPFVRIFDRRIIKAFKGNEDESFSQTECGPVQYFVPGHLPSKMLEYKRKFRSLASTYITFSPEGKELLVNLGGEQIYLFSVTDGLQPVSNFIVPDAGQKQSYSNGYTNGIKTLQDMPENYQIFRGMRPMKSPGGKGLPPAIEALKKKANSAFEKKKYSLAIELYNEAIKACSDSSVLFGNRSAALVYRAWDGDMYAALRDCQSALYLDPENFKALLRMSRCLHELKRTHEASLCLDFFKSQFPRYTKTELCKTLEEDIQRALAEEKASPSSAQSSSPPSSSAPTRHPTAADFVRDPAAAVIRHVFFEGDVDQEDNAVSNDDDDGLLPDSDLEEVLVPHRVASSDSSSSEPSGDHQNAIRVPKKPDLHDQENRLREDAIDFSERFCGHCNTTTDIKEANFFGGYVVAGSDDGSFYIWDRETTNIIKIVKGDDSIVNCLQPHPSTCMLATSGIESIVRLWSPMPEEGFRNERVVEDVNDAADANQRRMNTNPFEVILMNMGYRFNADGSDDEQPDEDARGRNLHMPCNPT